MKDFRSLEHKIRNIVSETVTRNTEQRMKIKNVGRPEDTDRSKLAKQGQIKTKIIDEASFKPGDKVSYETSKNNKNNKGVVHSVKGDKVTVKGSNYLGGEVLHDVHHSMVRKEETEIDEATKHKVKEDDQSDDPIARINNVTNNLKQMTNEPKPAPSLPNVNDIPSSNPASKMFKIKEAASDSFYKSDDKKKESKETKKEFKKNDGDDPKKITGGKTEVDLQPTTNDSPEMNDTEDKSSKKATNKANKEIGAKGVKEQVMSQKNFGLPESLIQAVNEVLKGKQKNLDKNHNGKIDGEDFKILRGKKMKEEVEQVDEDTHGYTLHKTGSKRLRDAHNDYSEPVKAVKTSYDVHQHGKKVGEIHHVDHDYEGHYYHGHLHGKRIPFDRTKPGEGEGGHAFLKSATKTKWHSKISSKSVKEEVEEIDEVSLKTKVSAYSARAKMNKHSGANYGDDDDRANHGDKMQHKTMANIQKHHGEKGVAAAKAAASHEKQYHKAGSNSDPTTHKAKWDVKTMQSGPRKGKLDKKDQEAIKGIHSTVKLPGIKGIKKPNLPEEVEFSAAELAHIEEIMNSDKATVAAKAVDKPEMKALNLSHGLPKGVK